MFWLVCLESSIFLTPQNSKRTCPNFTCSNFVAIFVAKIPTVGAKEGSAPDAAAASPSFPGNLCSQLEVVKQHLSNLSHRYPKICLTVKSPNLYNLWVNTVVGVSKVWEEIMVQTCTRSQPGAGLPNPAFQGLVLHCPNWRHWIFSDLLSVL